MPPGSDKPTGPVAPPRPGEIFRRNALQHASGQSLGDVLRLTPEWTRWATPVLIAAFVTALAYCLLGTVNEYASGPAVVWFPGRVLVTATIPGTVSKIEVKPGERVQAGQLLVSFSSAVELAEQTRLQKEFEVQLATSLREPWNQAARGAVTSLRSQLEAAAVRLEQRSVRAPQAGIVGDIRIRPGQLLQAGEVVLILMGQDRRCSVQAVLPAHYRPLLRPGMSLRFEVSGYSHAYQEMTITSIGVQIVGPTEVKRFLGQEIEDTMEVSGPVVLVEATPSAPTFMVDGQSYDFYHGMSGLAEVRVRSQRIVVALMPALRSLSGGSHD